MLHIYIQAGVGGRKKTAMTAIAMKETLKETNRLKSNCSANSSIYALLMVPCLLLLSQWPCGHCTESMHRNNTETSHANMRYAKSLTPSPTVAKIKIIRGLGFDR